MIWFAEAFSRSPYIYILQASFICIYLFQITLWQTFRHVYKAPLTNWISNIRQEELILTLLYRVTSTWRLIIGQWVSHSHAIAHTHYLLLSLLNLALISAIIKSWRDSIETKLQRQSGLISSRFWCHYHEHIYICLPIQYKAAGLTQLHSRKSWVKESPHCSLSVYTIESWLTMDKPLTSVK